MFYKVYKSVKISPLPTGKRSVSQTVMRWYEPRTEKRVSLIKGAAPENSSIFWLSWDI